MIERNGVQLRIGIGGWEHEVMDRLLYGRGDLTQGQKLARFAGTFDLAEIRPTFWDATLGARDAEGWVAAVQANPAFLLTVKLHREFTHLRSTPAVLRDRVREILQTLDAGGHLGGLLAQFPFSYTNTSANRFWVIRIAELFRGFPVRAEFRHISWCQPQAMQLLRDNGITVVNADMPRFGQWMPFHTGCGSTSVYIRLHGRNEKGWLLNGFEARYEYLYNGREVMELRRRIDLLPPQCREVMVVFNNTTSGNALANALQLRSALLGNRPVAVPLPLLRGFPQLQQIADHAAGNLDLFGSPELRTAV